LNARRDKRVSVRQDSLRNRDGVTCHQPMPPPRPATFTGRLPATPPEPATMNEMIGTAKK
jgi:hypothetical protein